MRTQLAKLTALDISHHQKIADKRIVELEATRDLSRIWLHVDMDAFYAAVETLCNPSRKASQWILKGVFGITTCEEMLQKSSLIYALFSRTSADFFLSVGLGLGRTDTPQVTQRKSIK